jgi:hypothetical protein
VLLDIFLPTPRFEQILKGGMLLDIFLPTPRIEQILKGTHNTMEMITHLGSTTHRPGLNSNVFSRGVSGLFATNVVTNKNGYAPTLKRHINHILMITKEGTNINHLVMIVATILVSVIHLILSLMVTIINIDLALVLDHHLPQEMLLQCIAAVVV